MLNSIGKQIINIPITIRTRTKPVTYLQLQEIKNSDTSTVHSYD